MGFFDTLGKKATEAYNVTTKKTGELAKEAKLRMKINENKSNINDLYKEIGKKVYEKHVRQENIDIKADLEEECAKIDILSSEIESCLTSILELKDKKQCIKCHAEIDENAVFCPKCGEKQPEIEVKEAEVVEEKTEKQEDKNEQESDNESNLQQVEEENNLEKTVEIESTPKLENGENVQEISYTEADEVEQQ